MWNEKKYYSIRSLCRLRRCLGQLFAQFFGLVAQRRQIRNHTVDVLLGKSVADGILGRVDDRFQLIVVGGWRVGVASKT